MSFTFPGFQLRSFLGHAGRHFAYWFQGTALRLQGQIFRDKYWSPEAMISDQSFVKLCQSQTSKYVKMMQRRLKICKNGWCFTVLLAKWLAKRWISTITTISTSSQKNAEAQKLVEVSASWADMTCSCPCLVEDLRCEGGFIDLRKRTLEKTLENCRHIVGIL